MSARARKGLIGVGSPRVIEWYRFRSVSLESARRWELHGIRLEVSAYLYT